MRKNGIEYFLDIAFSNEPKKHANYKINKYKDCVCNGTFIPIIFGKNCTIDADTKNFLKDTLHIFNEKEFYSTLGKLISQHYDICYKIYQSFIEAEQNE